MKHKLIRLLLLITFSSCNILLGCSNSTTESHYNQNNSTENNTSSVNSANDSHTEDSYPKANNNTTKTSNNTIQNDSIDKYTLTSKTYTSNNITITYPQINNLSDTAKADSINKLLKDAALNVLTSYTKAETNALTMQVDYKTALQNEKYLSIVYSGSVNLEGSAYPTSLFYTVNIDLASGSIMPLSNFADVSNITSKLKNPSSIKVLADTNELSDAQKAFLMNMNDSDLLDILKDSDFKVVNGTVQAPTTGTYSYITDEGIVVSLQVVHALGDHAEFLIK
jgi:hypothetical protein